MPNTHLHSPFVPFLIRRPSLLYSSNMQHPSDHQSTAIPYFSLSQLMNISLLVSACSSLFWHITDTHISGAMYGGVPYSPFKDVSLSLLSIFVATLKSISPTWPARSENMIKELQTKVEILRRCLTLQNSPLSSSTMLAGFRSL